jgi:hypothetical protein
MTKPPVQKGFIPPTHIHATNAMRNPRPTVTPLTFPPKLTISSNEKRTPPMGAPKATATPAAEEAAYISRMDRADRCIGNNREMVCPAHTATWTLGPSFPTLNPEAMARGSVMVLMTRLVVSFGIMGGLRGESEEALHDEACDDTFYFADAAAGGIGSKCFYQEC